MIRTPPRIRKYSMNAGLVTQKPVSGKHPAWASVSRDGGARAEMMATIRNAQRTATRFMLYPLLTWLDNVRRSRRRHPTVSATISYRYQLSSGPPVLLCRSGRACTAGPEDNERPPEPVRAPG